MRSTHGIIGIFYCTTADGQQKRKFKPLNVSNIRFSLLTVILSGVTLEDLKQFVPTMLSPSFWEILMHGNITKEAAEALVNDILAVYNPEPLPQNQMPQTRIVQLKQGN